MNYKIIDRMNTVAREILIYPIAIMVLPILSIRCLVWSWLFWVRLEEHKIRLFNKRMNEVNKYNQSISDDLPL